MVVHSERQDNVTRGVRLTFDLVVQILGVVWTVDLCVVRTLSFVDHRTFPEYLVESIVQDDLERIADCNEKYCDALVTENQPVSRLLLGSTSPRHC